jgi:hypothetical protein
MEIRWLKVRFVCKREGCSRLCAWLISSIPPTSHTVDFEVGRVVDALHRTGLANDTLVLITSDNGPWDVSSDGMEDVRLKTESAAKELTHTAYPTRVPIHTIFYK